MKRCFIVIIFLFLSGYFPFSWLSTLWAQGYPARPIQIIIPLDAGSAVDTMARNFADELSKVLKIPILAINKPGAASALGTDFVVKSKKDGYTILYANASAVVYSKASNPEQVPYDPIRDNYQFINYELQSSMGRQNAPSWISGCNPGTERR